MTFFQSHQTISSKTSKKVNFRQQLSQSYLFGLCFFLIREFILLIMSFLFILCKFFRKIISIIINKRYYLGFFLMQNQPSKGIFGRLVLIVVAFLALLILYCDRTFPAQLKHISAQKFQSHPLRDLSGQVLSQQTLQNSFILNDISLGKCEDVQIGKKDIAYCVNEVSQIYELDIKKKSIKKIGDAEKGASFGSRLSNDQKFLYFTNSQLGLCQFNFETGKVKSLVSNYENQFLNALNSIQIHPSKPQVIYFTQTNPLIPMYLHNIDIILNNPFGRLFQFNKKTQKLSLITTGLYFPNGIAFQQFKGQSTLLLAQTDRLRLLRVYLQGQKRGIKQVAVDKLDFFVDNVKANQKGQIWVAGPAQRDLITAFIDYHPWLRTILSRLPQQFFKLVANKKYLSGVKITFSQDKQSYQTNYYIWKSLPDFGFVTTFNQKNNKLYLSSLISNGVLVINQWDEVIKIKRQNQSKTSKQEL